jgi:hypothetical protein
MWGVFEIDERIHVAPANENGEIDRGHELDDFCRCNPEATLQEGATVVIVHNEIH